MDRDYMFGEFTRKENQSKKAFREPLENSRLEHWPIKIISSMDDT